MRLRNAEHPKGAGISNACVASSIASITGMSTDDVVQMLRKYDSKACTRREGSGPDSYKPVLASLGFEIDAHYLEGYGPIAKERQTPIHKALAILNKKYPGSTYLLIMKERRSTHMAVAQGFIVVDNTSRSPMWYADWLEVWQRNRSYYRNVWPKYRLSKPRPARIAMAYVVRKKAQVSA